MHGFYQSIKNLFRKGNSTKIMLIIETIAFHVANDEEYDVKKRKQSIIFFVICIPEINPY